MSSHLPSVLLTSCLAAHLCAAPVEVVNKGVGGNSTRDGLARYARDVERAATVHLILCFGMNDALNSAKLVPLEQFRANLQQMIDRARKAGVRTIVLATPNPIVAHYVKKRHPSHPETDLAAWLAAYGRAVREIAAANRLPLVDLDERFRSVQPDMEARDSLVRNLANSGSADGVHPTAAGYEAMAGWVAAALGEAVRPGDRVVCFGDSITFGAHMRGAGTATGDTYPAWLAAVLNRKLGLPEAVRPPATRP